jgi:hypothetical protein
MVRLNLKYYKNKETILNYLTVPCRVAIF